MRTYILVIILSLALTASLSAKVNIPLDDPKISYDGIWFAQKSPAKVILNRLTESVILNSESGISSSSAPYARTQTCVRIRFKTKSKNINMSFEERADAGKAGLHNGFAIYADGVKQRVFETLSFSFSSPWNDNRAVEYTVVLPSLHGVNFTGLSIDDGFALEDIAPLNKPVLAVIGTSISHGTGQQSASFYTYPYIAADNMGWDLVNLAVAGAGTGWPVSLLFKEQKADYIIVELGFNDWQWDNKPLSAKLGQYTKLIDSLRAFQKKAKIICITPIVTTFTTTQMNCSFRLEDYREMVRGVVNAYQQKGDTLIYVVHGDSLTDASMLQDGVHLNETGALKFGNALSIKLKEIIFKPPVVDTTFKILWERDKSTGSMPAWFSPASSSERGLAYANDKLYVVGRWGATNIFMLDWFTGNDIGKMNVSGISGGTLTLNDVEADQDGNIYACNLANANNEVFKIYKWKNGAENSEPEALISYNAGTERLGDNFNVSGTVATGITILAASAKSDKVFRWKVINGKPEGPEILNLPATPAFGVVTSVAPKDQSLNCGFYVSSFSTAPKEYDFAGNIKIGELNNGGGVIKILTASNQYILHMRPMGGNLEIYSVNKENLAASPIEKYGVTVSLGSNQNINQTGDVAYRRDSNGNTVFFVLSTNNGLAAFWARKGNDLYKGKQLLTDVKAEAPTCRDFKLYQNYPNPFNPSTSIEYYLDNPGFVKLIIYDLTGREIAVVVNEFKVRGNHKAVFTADSKLASGLYFCRLITPKFTSVRKMALIK